ncbi:Uncharacterised protein [Neisseria sicca]|nr:Uncharacterised protein [Neisseria sicca]
MRCVQSVCGQNTITCFEFIGIDGLDSDFVFQFDFNAFCSSFSNDVLVVAFEIDGFTQFGDIGCSVVTRKCNTLAVDSSFRLHAFLNLSFGVV